MQILPADCSNYLIVCVLGRESLGGTGVDGSLAAPVHINSSKCGWTLRSSRQGFNELLSSVGRSGKR